MVFSDSSNFIIEGLSQSGKSCFARQLIRESENLFRTPPKAAIYVYEFYDPTFEELRKDCNMDITLTATLPKFDDLAAHCKKYPHSLFIIDDITSDKLTKNQYFVDLFCKGSHHLNVSIILNCHDILSSSSKNRNLGTILKSAHVYVLMSCAKARQKILSISRQTHNYKFLRDAYKDATNNCTPYKYLICNFHPASPNIFRYLTNIFSQNGKGDPLTLYIEDDEC